MTTTTPANVVGYATYIEAERPMNVGSPMKYVYQTLLMPEGAHSGRPLAMSMYSRRISTTHPRKTWRFVSSSMTYDRAQADVSPLFTPTVRAWKLTESMLGFTGTRLGGLVATNQQAGLEWKLVGQPVVVEVTDADFADVALGKTPYKVFGRVWKARKVLGFPTEFV